ncbi:MAG: hypothetical protein QW228_08925 [Candidatus Aenigmatarchaeota archaeon]
MKIKEESMKRQVVKIIAPEGDVIAEQIWKTLEKIFIFKDAGEINTNYLIAFTTFKDISVDKLQNEINTFTIMHGDCIPILVAPKEVNHPIFDKINLPDEEEFVDNVREKGLLQAFEETEKTYIDTISQTPYDETIKSILRYIVSLYFMHIWDQLSKEGENELKEIEG